MGDEEPEQGWFVTGDRKWTDRRSPYIRVSTQQIVDALPFVARYFRYWLKYVRQKDQLFIDTFRPLTWKPYFGVPCGGMGCGSMGRDYRGGFRKFSMRPGLVEHHVDIIPADQFIATVRSKDKTLYQQVLCAAPVSSRSLSEWSFNFPSANIKYHGLYPRSWTHYDLPVNGHNVTMTCRQVSPVIPNNYKDSCLPVCVFEWNVSNAGVETVDVSVTFTMRDGTGDPRWIKKAGVKVHEVNDDQVTGLSLQHTIAQMPITYTVVASNHADYSVTYRTFNPAGCGKKLWLDLMDDGRLDSISKQSKSSKQTAIAVCAQVNLPPNTTKQIRFVLAWDMPIIHFPGKRRQYKRRYTRYFGSDLNAGLPLVRYATQQLKEWDKAIDEWQSPILNNPQLPEWYKSAIFNELYFLTDGGSIWVEYEDSWAKDEPHLTQYAIELMREYGRFAYLESWEYRMLNTYDVHFYASFALFMLFPGVEQCMQIEFACQLYSSDPTPVKYFYDGAVAPAKTLHRLPHDLGNPGIGLLTSTAEDPWLMTNSYLMHNTGEWRDLNLKFILISYRDMMHICPHDKKFKEAVWPAIKIIIAESLAKWDTDGDCLIENSGTCDQTYDAWKMKGPSAYCGGLWLACLRIGAEMAKLMGELELSDEYLSMLSKASASFDTKLWNGQYFNFDQVSDSIMADQLCGYWFLLLTHPNIAEEILPEEHVKKCLETIFEKNVLGFGDGKMGAVNGMKPNGKKDRCCIQAEEVWTGVTYALASLFLHKGMVDEALQTAGGMFNTCFNKLGLQYQTPEAIYERLNYRAVGYMRPLAIWAMQWTLQTKHNFPNLPLHTFPIAQSE